MVSAHRTPALLYEYAEFRLGAGGWHGIIAGAGGAAHLPGMLAAKTTIPILGVPIPSRQGLNGLDSLLSIVQMPAGVPVATFAIGEARNAGLLAVRILAATNPELRRQMQAFQSELAEAVREKDDGVRKQFE